MKTVLHKKPLVIERDRPWFPKSLKDLREDKVVYVQFSKAERRVLRKRKKIPVSDWAERHRYVTRGPLEGARFKKDTFPYAAGIMDASFYPSVEEIVQCTADQVGKSFVVDTCLGYAMDREPGPVMIVYPGEKTTKENIKDRIIPMIKLSSRLRSYLTGEKDDETSSRVNLQHMQIYASWANSAIQLANRSVKYLDEDEIDKYPITPNKKEAGTLDKAEKRLRAYRWGRKCWKSSTPTIESGLIWQALNVCQVVFAFWVCCPDCGTHHVMEFETEHRWFRWPEKERDPEKIQNEDLAWYVCPHCESIWRDLKRDAAVKWGEWRAMDKTPDGQRVIEGGGLELTAYLKKYHPKKIGFHVPSWISPLVGISEVCAAFLRGQKDKLKLRDFQNSYKAVPWTDWTQERQEDVILALRDDRPRGLVPSGGMVAGLTASVDTHKNHFIYEIRAWGWGLIEESWQIREGSVTSFEALTQILWEDEYKDAEDNVYHIHLTVQDAMGAGRTSEVYDFARKNRGRLMPFQGVQRMRQPYAFSKIDVYPGTNKRIPGGLQLLRADVNYFKNKLANKLETAPADPGAWHLHNETSYDWACQMCAEFTDENGFWQCPEGRANEGWDLSVYNLVAAEVIGIRFWKKQKQAPAEKPKKKPEEKSWVPKKPNWFD